MIGMARSYTLLDTWLVCFVNATVDYGIARDYAKVRY